ncbi:MAG: hypothetical protein RLO80_11515 [Hyphomonas sp.]
MVILSVALTAALTAILTGGVAILTRKAKPKHIEGSVGVISPGKVIAWITVISGAMIMAGSIVFAIMAAQFLALIPAAVACTLGAAIAGFMLPSLTSVHDISWDATSMEGPCSLFGPTLGVPRTRLDFDTLVTTGKTTTGYWFVEATDGRRIYWSYLYNGYGELTKALKARVPNLQLPADLG